MARPGFEIVNNETDEPSAPPAEHTAATNLMLLALRSLSQRAVAALADLFFLSTVFSAFWLWWGIPDPNPRQIVALGIYALFVLAANVIVRRM